MKKEFSCLSLPGQYVSYLLVTQHPALSAASRWTQAGYLIPFDGAAQRARRWRAEGAPKASPSTPVRSRPGQGARNHTSNSSERYGYSSELLKHLQFPVHPSCSTSMNVSETAGSCGQCAFKLQPCLAPFHQAEGQNTTYKILLLNCRSLPKHIAELSILLLEENLDVLFLTETWTSPYSDPDMVQALPPGFLHHRLDRSSGKGGGIAIIYKSIFKCRILGSPVLDCENLHFTISCSPLLSLSGILIYRPPGPVGQFLTSLLDSETRLACLAPNFTILGDLNIHFDDPSSKVALDMLEDLSALQFSQRVLKATHEKGHLLDPVFSNLLNLICLDPIPIPWSDHHVISLLWSPKLVVPFVQPIRKRTRCWSRLS